MFTEVLFRTAKMWKQLKHPATLRQGEWINKMWYIPTM